MSITILPLDATLSPSAIEATLGRTDAVRVAVREVDPNQPLRKVKTMQQSIALQTIGLQYAATVMEGAFVGVLEVQPLSFVIFAVILFSVSLLAGYVPARRALSIDPAIALREE